jgi:hypothetical protein
VVVLVRSVLLVGLLLVAACGGQDTEGPASTTAAAPSTTTTTTTAPAPVGGLVATVEYSRLFSLQRALGLGLRNVGEVPVVVRSFQLESPLFEPAAFAEREVLLPAHGRRLVMPVPFGPARCEGEPEERFGAIVRLADGTELRLDAPEDHAGTLGRQHDRECASRAVQEQVAVVFGDDWEADGLTISGELRLEALVDGADASLDEVVGSVIFRVAIDREAPVLRVGAERALDRVPVTISAQRCDAHALAESKKTFVFLTWVSLGGGEAVPVELHPAGAARAALEGLLDACMA